jgi:hypothetical protein
MTLRLAPITITMLILALANSPAAGQRTHPRLMANQAEIDLAKSRYQAYPWYRHLLDEHRKELDRFIAHGPVYVSPIKQTYEYQMYTCPKHRLELLYDEFKPFEHHCPADTQEVFRGGKYDMAWAGWYNRVLANRLVWMGLLYCINGEERYAVTGRQILMDFAELYLKYPTGNTILGPAHVFFGTLSESFWGVDMAYGYDLLYNYPGFTEKDRRILKDSLFYPLARITQLFPESASNRQLWYNNVSAAVGFLYGDEDLIKFALQGKYGFDWQLGSALPESGFWPEWSGYHFVALRGMIHLAEMARHNGTDLYDRIVAGRTMKKMFDAPFLLVKPNYEFPRCKDSGGGSILEYAPYYDVGYAVYRDPKYLTILNLSRLDRGSQLVGETSALGRAPEPITLFSLVPDLPSDTVSAITQESVDLPGNGFAVLRGKHEQTYLYLDYGIMGGEHGHPDRLQMGYYATGRNWIVDPLNESYMNPNLQLWFRQSIAHNTLVVDQTTQTWTNGFGRFFGSVPSLQVASGGCTSAYPGVSLARTLVQCGGYFLDIFDAKAPEKHIYDLPLHSFGSLTVTGVELERQPVDLFGMKPGIPGYDQLTDMFLGKTDTKWKADFKDKGSTLSLYVLGEPGTEVLQTMTPSIGGFYKQMIKEQVPLPMVMSRRYTTETRFASLIHASLGTPQDLKFDKGDKQGEYIVQTDDTRDLLHIDVDHSIYWMARKEHGVLAVIAGLNFQEVRDGSALLLSLPSVLNHFQCSWSPTGLDVIASEEFTSAEIRSPDVTAVTLNGRPVDFHRRGEFIDIAQKDHPVVTVEGTSDSILFAGRRNRVAVTISNPTSTPLRGNTTIRLAADWMTRMQSQLEWWGGIVNLVATNKGPIERRTSPSSFRRTAEWIDGITSETRTINAGSEETFLLDIDVPGDAAPVVYPGFVVFNHDTVRNSFVVKAPVTAHLTLPNGEKEIMRIDLSNETPDRLTVQYEITLDPAWKTGENLRTTVQLGPLETKHITIPLHLTGYKAENQRYPIRLKLKTGGYEETIAHDYYVSIAHFAKSPPALDGSWKGWNRRDPVTIDKETQVCRLLFGNQPWLGKRDLSAEVYAMYDASYIYVGASVFDDSLVTHWDFPRMSYPWDTDCMEVVLDVRTTSGQGKDPPTPGLFRHLALAEYRRTDFCQDVWQGGGAGGPLLPKPNLVSGTETYFHRTVKGYVMIARFPISSLKGFDIHPGSKIGFDIAINDNDGTNYRKNQHIWAGYTQNQSWWDMGTIGAIVFGPRK